MVDLTCNVDGSGKLPAWARDTLGRAMRHFAGSEVRIRVGKPNRTTQANRFYWSSVIKPIADAMQAAGIDTTPEAVHVYFKRRFLAPRTMTGVNGEPMTVEPTTTTLDKHEFHEYIEKIKASEEVRQLLIKIEQAPKVRSGKITEPSEDAVMV